jgi:glycosyltransferase involved in cell wall biosynthesis
MKVLLVTDYSKKYLGGAQVIVGHIENQLRDLGCEVEVFSYDSKLKSLCEINLRIRQNTTLRSLRSLINPHGLLVLRKKIREFKPNVIWFHNINNEWSWSSLLLGRNALNRVITFHDLSPLSNFKIRPENLGVGLRFSGLNGNAGLLRRKVSQARINFIRYCLRKLRTSGIGRINADILRNNGFRVDYLIPNRIFKCQHKETELKIKKSVLFAGRSYLKGIREISIAAEEYDWTLYLAGDPSLILEASEFCSGSKIHYLGRLSNADLLSSIHSFELVSVCSQYYDNYPTIALEALVHGSLPFTTTCSGASEYLMKLNPKLVVNPGEIPNLPLILQTAKSMGSNIEILIKEITDIELQNLEYSNLISFNSRHRKIGEQI